MKRASIWCWVLATSFLYTSFLSLSWATKVRRRHSIHNSANPPDDSQFSLENLANIFYDQLNGPQGGNPWPRGPPSAVNPFGVTPQCKPNKNKEFRSINGVCNNLQRPLVGAAKTPLARLAASTYEDGTNAPRSTFFSSNGLLKAARAVSLAVHNTTSSLSDKYSHLLMNFGQFLDHDITLSPEAAEEEGAAVSAKDMCCTSEWVNNLKECFALPTPEDPVFTTTCIGFLRSAPVPGFPSDPVERHQLNDLTAFVDASQVYGNTKLKADSLRTFQDGKLKSSTGLNNEERLPLATDNPADCSSGTEECRFDAGDIRNSEQAALTSLHTLMLQEHNRIAGKLKVFNIKWKDEQLYQTTRKIIGAILQRITYKEFLPEVLGPGIMDTYGLTLLENGRFSGYSAMENASIVNEFSTAAFRFGHSLIRQTFSHSSGSLDIEKMFNSYQTVEEYGSHGLLEGLSSDNMEGCDRFITQGVRDRLFGLELDLPALNIQRGRDHGLASYNAIRQFFNLNVKTTFTAMVGQTHNQNSVDALANVYPAPADVELFPGGLSETPLPGAVVGQTFAHIIGEQFRRIRNGDRFWHETNISKIRFTDEQLAEIRKASLAGLYCNNIPGVSVRSKLMLANITGNPPESCDVIPVMDLSKWKGRQP